MLDVVEIIIWTLRILLPFSLFWIYLKLQPPSFKDQGRQGCVLSRQSLLAHRKLAAGGSSHQARVPKMADQATAPQLFKPEAEVKSPKRERTPERVHKVSTGESKAQLEQLVNYMAFNRWEQQRTFFSDMDSKKANADAVVILKCAVNMKRKEVIMDLYEQLMDSQVEIAEHTFTHVIKACMEFGLGESAGSVLVQMEAAGHRPSAGLVDRVMELYSQSRSVKRTALNPTAQPLEVPRTALNPTAKPFEESPKKKTALSDMAVPFCPSSWSTSSKQKTELSAMASPFQPSLAFA